MREPLALGIATIAMLSASAGVLWRSEHSAPRELAAPIDSLGASWNGIAGADTKLTQEELDLLRPTAYVRRSYHAAEEIDFLFVYFSSQEIGHSIHSPKNCLPLSGSETRGLEIAEIGPQGNRFPVNLYRIRLKEANFLVLYWFETPGRAYADEYAGKLYMIFDRLVHRRSAAGMTRIVVADTPEAIKLAQDFAVWVQPRIRAVVPKS